ncbi:amidotransferase-related protein [hydrothermal vent metagenome]|uniref:Amidotransferase-related protein n=1 Tax=hydrothermal vent metagenome TaxID=652676 RepID=A0A3B0YB55_9ZZZZ
MHYKRNPLLIFFALWFTLIPLTFILQGCTPPTTHQHNKHSFQAVESTIAQLHLALSRKTDNCKNITETFLKRIKTYDQSTDLNAIILINENAIKKAETLDIEYARTKQLRPLHCIPVILKDNFDTADMPTEAGSIALKGSFPADDAFMVKRLREAGAIILARSNMSEWAFSAYNTISSTHGETRNAYNIQHVPAGSSGGTASAIAASFAIIGMGTDTGNSIRGPASHLSLVGMRSTIGLTSRDGIVPLMHNRDIAGPLTRTVEDGARTFNIISGYDAADPMTHNPHSKKNTDYTRQLKKSGLKGVRLGVIRQLYDTELADFEVLDLMDQAIKDLKNAGAIIIDPFEIKHFKKLRKASGFCSRFRYDLNQYLSTLKHSHKQGKNNTRRIRKFQDIIDRQLYGEHSRRDMNWAASVKIPPQQQQPPCTGIQDDPRRRHLLAAVLQAMDRQNIEAIIYPTWSNPPREIGDNTSPHGDNSSTIAPHTGQPAITVPMGYTSNNLPAGLEFLARPFDDAQLFEYAYAYEQQTRHRRPPVLFPPLSISK